MEWSDPSIAEGLWKLAGALDKGLARNKNTSSTRQDVVEEFYGIPPIGQKASDGWDTVSFPVGRRSRWRIQKATACSRNGSELAPAEAGIAG
jgi:hypothetical protein